MKKLLMVSLFMVGAIFSKDADKFGVQIYVPMQDSLCYCNMTLDVANPSKGYNNSFAWGFYAYGPLKDPRTGWTYYYYSNDSDYVNHVYKGLTFNRTSKIATWKHGACLKESNDSGSKWYDAFVPKDNEAEVKCVQYEQVPASYTYSCTAKNYSLARLNNCSGPINGYLGMKQDRFLLVPLAENKADPQPLYPKYISSNYGRVLSNGTRATDYTVTTPVIDPRYQDRLLFAQSQKFVMIDDINNAMNRFPQALSIQQYNNQNQDWLLSLNFQQPKLESF